MAVPWRTTRAGAKAAREAESAGQATTKAESSTPSETASNNPRKITSHAGKSSRSGPVLPRGNGQSKSAGNETSLKRKRSGSAAGTSSKVANTRNVGATKSSKIKRQQPRDIGEGLQGESKGSGNSNDDGDEVKSTNSKRKNTNIKGKNLKHRNSGLAAGGPSKDAVNILRRWPWIGTRGSQQGSQDAAPSDDNRTRTSSHDAAPSDNDRTRTSSQDSAPSDNDRTRTPSQDSSPSNDDRTGTSSEDAAPSDDDRTVTPSEDAAPSDDDRTVTPSEDAAPSDDDLSGSPSEDDAPIFADDAHVMKWIDDNHVLREGAVCVPNFHL